VSVTFTEVTHTPAPFAVPIPWRDTVGPPDDLLLYGDPGSTFADSPSGTYGTV
jgi:hypothetical protein